jgi:hypothetical protein
MSVIHLFLQFQGDRRIELIQVDENAPVRDIIAAAIRAGFPEDGSNDAVVFGHDRDEPYDLMATLTTAGIRHKDRVHVHRCRKIEVTVQFNDRIEKHPYPPAATVEQVKRDAVKKFQMSAVDATEHVLQICGTTDRPEPDVHIGALVSGNCTLCFNLVPIKRIEG